MSATALRSLLGDVLTPGNIHQLAAESDAWFRNEPGVASFVLRALFGELADAWGDDQGAPEDQVALVNTALMAPLKELLDSLTQGDGTKPLFDVLNRVAQAHSSHLPDA